MIYYQRIIKMIPLTLPNLISVGMGPGDTHEYVYISEPTYCENDNCSIYENDNCSIIVPVVVGIATVYVCYRVFKWLSK